MNQTRQFSLFWALILLFCSARSQVVFLDSAFAVRHETVFYGAPVNYRGCVDSLFMDLYKPVNAFENRPIVILMHGGSFVAGGKTAPNLVRLGDSLAARGYVTASIEYRLGHHIVPNLSPSFGCLIFQGLTGITLDACAYPADTAEQVRALYRAMQDCKGAIRFLKGRSAVDSTDHNRVFIGGESAGGFVALAAGTLDREAEKPAACGALGNAPIPSGPVVCNLNNPCGTTSYARPDLGSVRGDLNLNGETDEVVGILSFAGGIMDPTVLDTNVSHPRMYIYHQECDPVVPADREKIYYRVNNCVYCSGCPVIGNVNKSSGGFALLDYNQNLPGSGQYDMWEDTIHNGGPVSCYYGLWGPSTSTCPQPLNTCRYCGNTLYSQCHNLILTPARMDSISRFLYEGTPITSVPETGWKPVVYPNPFADELVVRGPELERVVVYDLQGRMMSTLPGHGSIQVRVPTGMLSDGLYLLEVLGVEGERWVQKVVKGSGM
ncbi:MAG: carboxylesterase family protein [Bacteroidia bacterium]|nr:carboxylesterase family protein [Bacteroidia bacterium]